MVQIRPTRSKFRLRHLNASRHKTILDKLPYFSNLSPADRLLLLCGVALLSVVSCTYLFLLSNISSSIVASGGDDPRLSSELRKTGLSPAALLRRGGGKRISHLNSEENAVALDIARELKCDELQEKLDQEWKDALARGEARRKEMKEWEERYGGGSGGGGGDFGGGNSEETHGDGNERVDDFVNRRRLDGIPQFDDPGGNNFENNFENNYENNFGNDFENNFGNNIDYEDESVKLHARHLFCLAADALALPQSTTTTAGPSLHCDVTTPETRESILSLWSSARSQMSLAILERTLDLAREHTQTLRQFTTHLWYPDNDAGTEGMLRVLNSAYEGREVYNFDQEAAEEGRDDLYRFWDLPSKYMGPNKLFVDVGSALGLTSMLIALLYPQTTIVSIEPAAPSWLIQQLNFRCNLPPDKLQFVHSVLAGVGTKHHDDNDSMMKMLWRPSMTTATRGWSSQKDYNKETDIELTVHLKTLRAILAEATPEDLPLGTPVSVMNLDCEGCEYNLIPSMPETSFHSIGILLGRTNWGFIPTIKKPSSERAKTTHQRVCVHYNFARRCKECCDFPSVQVLPRLRNEEDSIGEGGETGKTVGEVAGSLCDGFDEWAQGSRLHDIPDDFGWNEMSPFATDEDLDTQR